MLRRGAYLVLNVKRSNTGPVVHLDGPGNHGGAAEAGVGVGDQRNRAAEVGDHGSILDKVWEGGDGQVGLAELGSSGRSSTIQNISVPK